MKPIRKVLVLGIGQSNFLDQLYGELRKTTHDFDFTLGDYKDISGNNLGPSKEIYKGSLGLSRCYRSRIDLILALSCFLMTRFCWQIIFFELSRNFSIRDVYSEVVQYARARRIVKRILIPSDFDIFHFHYCVPENLRYLQFLPEDATIVCSFWGSDLMRTSGAKNAFYVERALAKSTRITIQTTELAQILCCKYGQGYRERITTLLFTLNRQIYDQMDQNPSGGSVFRERFGIPETNLVIAIGHNGFEANNHLPVCRELERLPKNILERITVILHVGYGGQPSYIKQVETYALNQDCFDCRVIFDFFDPEQTAIFRLATDIYIHMPVSDALSGTMTEFLHAGSQVISADWLPYQIMKRNGLMFTEVSSFTEAADKVEEIACGKGLYNDDSLSSNASRLEFLFPKATTDKWRELFTGLSSSNRENSINQNGK